MEWPPPITRDTVTLLRLFIISAIARPASTSPPTVFKITNTPLMLLFCSIETS